MTLRFLADLPDRKETLVSVFSRHRHSSLGGKRYSLDHLSFLVDSGVIGASGSVADAIKAIKRIHREDIRAAGTAQSKSDAAE